MNITQTDTLPDVSPHTFARLHLQAGGTHAAPAIAGTYDVSSSTIRNYWNPWQQTQMYSIELSIADQLSSLEAIIDPADTAELNISVAAQRTAMTLGQQRMIALYKIELQAAEPQTTTSLRPRCLQKAQ